MNKELQEATTRTHGVPEVSVDFVKETLGQYRLVDCREVFELQGELGAIEGVDNVPMGAIRDALKNWDDSPMIIVCRSGARSGSVALALEQVGFTQVASMAGGMLAWMMAGYPCR